MSVKVEKREYSELYSDQLTDWLLGNTGDWQKALYEVLVSVDAYFSQTDPLEIDYINNAFILSNGDNWGSKGFDAGMTVTFIYQLSRDTTGDGEFDTVQNVQNDYTVTNVYGSVMEVEETIQADDFDNIPINFGTKKITDARMFSTTDIEGMKLRFALIPNDDETGNLNSIIDGTITEFVLPELNELNPGQWQNLEPVGKQSGHAVQYARIRPFAGQGDQSLGHFAAYNPEETLIFQDHFDEFDTLVNAKMLLYPDGPTPDLQSVTQRNEVPQNNNDGVGTPLDGNQWQAFIFDVAGTFSRQFYLNVYIRITNVFNVKPDDKFKLVFLKYTNGVNMNFVEEIEIQTWFDPQSLINTSLNYVGLVDVDFNPSDSLVFAVKYERGQNASDYNSINYIFEQFIVQVSKNDTQFSLGDTRKYELEVKYMLSSLFEDLNNFQNDEMPEYLQGEGSLKDNLLLEFYPEWNNPNVKIKNDIQETNRLGNTGWFNENFNNLDNDFNIESIKYFDQDGNEVDALDYKAQTKVVAEISGVPNINSNTKCGFGFAWIPSSADAFQEKDTSLHRNLFVQTGDKDHPFMVGQLYPDINYGYGINGASMDSSNVKFSQNGSNLIFEALLTPTSEFGSFFDDRPEADRHYIIWLSVADSTLNRQFSDRVSLIADFDQMQNFIPPAGEYDEMDNAFIEHPQEADVVGVEQYNGFTQDDVLCRLPFRIPNDGNTVFQKMTFGVEMYDQANDESFELESYEVDLGQYPTDQQGVQQIDLDQGRGFKLNNGNNKNWVKVERNEDLDSINYNGYLAYYAFKIRYEDWIEKSNVINEFFDSEEINNGYHNDWYHYLSQEGWSINLFVISEVIEDGQLLAYKNRFKFRFNDNDKNELINTTHNYFRYSDGSLINVGNDLDTGNNLGVILQNELTRVEIEFEIQDSGSWDINAVYGVITLESYQGEGITAMRQISSVWPVENDNPLRPLQGEENLKMEVDGTGKIIKLICIVDPELLEQANKYRITGRVGCFESQDAFEPGLYEFRYEEKYE